MTPGKAIDRIRQLRAGLTARMESAIATARTKAEQREQAAVQRVLDRLTPEDRAVVERAFGGEP